MALQGIKINNNFKQTQAEFDLMIKHMNDIVKVPINISVNINEIKRQFQEVNSQIDSAMKNNKSLLNADDTKKDVDKVIKSFEEIKNELSKLGEVKINVTELDKASEKAQKFTATVKEAEGIISKFSYEASAFNGNLSEPIGYSLTKKGYTDTTQAVQNKQAIDDASMINQIEEKRLQMIKNREIEEEKANQTQQKQVEQAKLESIELEKQVQQYKEMAMIKLQNLKTTGGDALKNSDIANQVKEYENQIKSLNTSNFDSSRLNTDFAQLKANIKEVNFEAKNSGNVFSNLYNTITHDIGAMVQWAVSGTVIFGTVRELEKGIADVVQMDKTLSTLSITMNGTKEQFMQMASSIQQTAIATGSDVKSVEEAAKVYANMQESTESIMAKTKSAIMLGNVSGLNVGEVTDSIHAIINEYNLAGKDAQQTSEHIADSLVSISKNLAMDFGQGIEEITKGIQVVGTVANKTAKQTSDETEAMIGAIVEQTRLGGEQVGNGLKTVIARIYQSKSIDPNVSDEDLSNMSAMLTKLGVSVRDVSGAYRPLNQILSEINEKEKTMTDSQKQAVNIQAAGVRQANIFSVALDTIGKSTELANKAMTANGEVVQANAKYMDTVSAKVKTLNSTITAIWQQSVNSDIIKGAIDEVTSLVKVFGNLPSIVGLATTAFLVFKGQAIQGSITSMVEYQMALGATTTSEALLASGTSALATTFNGLKVAIATNPLGALAVLLTTVISITSIATNKIEEQKRKEEELQQQRQASLKTLQEETQVSMKSVSDINKLLDEQKNIQSRSEGNRTADEKKRLVDIERQLASAIPESTTGYDNENKALAENYDLTKKLANLKKDEATNKAESVINSIDVTKEENNLKNYKKMIDNIHNQLNSSLTFGSEGQNQSSIKFYNDNAKSFTDEERKNLSKSMNDEKAYHQALAQIMEDRNKKYFDGIGVLKNYNSAVEYYNNLGNKQYTVSQYANEILRQNTQDTKNNTNAKDDNANSTDDQLDSQEKLSKSFDDTTEKIRFYNTVIAETQTKAGLSASSMKEIIKNHSELIPYLNNEAQLRDVLSQKVKEEEANQVNAYNKMISASADYYNAKIRNNATAQNAINGALKSMVSNQGTAYSVDLKNYNNLNQLKLDATVKTVREVAGVWSRYYQAESQQFTQDFWRGILDMSMSSNPVIRAQASQMEKIANQTQDAVNRMNGVINSVGTPNISFQGLNTEGISAIDRANNEASKSAEEAAKKAEQARNDAYQAIDDINKKLMDSIKQQVENEKKALDERLKNYENFINDKLKALDNEYTTEDRQRKLAEEKKKKEELQAQQAELLLDSSDEARNRRYDLQQQIDTQQQAIDDLNRDYSREDRKANLQNQLDAYQKQIEQQKQALDNKYTDAEIARMANAGLNGALITVGNQSKTAKQMLIDAMIASGDAFTVAGQKLQSELIDKLVKVQQLVANMDGNGNISGNVALNIMGSHANGGIITYQGLAKLHGSSNNPEIVLNGGQQRQLADNIWKMATKPIPMPKVDTNAIQRGSGNITLKIESLIGTVQGSVDKSTLPLLEKLIEEKVPQIVANTQVNNDKRLGSYRPRLV